MRWAGYVARTGRENVHTGFWWENMKERYKFGKPSVDGG